MNDFFGRQLMLSAVVSLSVGSIILTGCTVPVATTKPEAAQPAPASKPKPVVPRGPTVQQRVDVLLREAESSMRADRLMSPEDNNAYDRYKAVLLLQPSNTQAVSGLQQMVIRYVQLGRGALRHSQVSQAKLYASRANYIEPNNGLVKELEREIARAPVAPPPVKVSASAPDEPASDNEYPLNTAALDRQGDDIKRVLATVAARVKTSDEALLIVARNDAEGRWLYKEMKKAATGYRIRGDIKIGPKPKIVVFPPI